VVGFQKLSIVAVLLFFFYLPLSIIAYAVLGPILNAGLTIGPLLVLQYWVYYWAKNRISHGRDDRG
jgi:hypothetical protein